MIKKTYTTDGPSTKRYTIDWDKLKNTVNKAVRFLDNVITVNNYPLPEIEEEVKKYRKIGLGVMGFHEMLIKLGVPYDSDQAVRIAKDVMKFINEVGHEYSEKLANEKGSFPCINESVYQDEARRNATITTIAPTGSISFLAGTSGGIEPFFSFKYSHTDADGNVSWFEYDFTEEADEDVLVTAMDIDPEWHIKIQAAFQEHVDNAVSKTINLPNEATAEDVRHAYKLAYELGCKGLTVYRDGSKTSQVLSSDDEDDEKSDIGIEDSEIPSSEMEKFVDEWMESITNPDGGEKYKELSNELTQETLESVNETIPNYLKKIIYTLEDVKVEKTNNDGEVKATIKIPILEHDSKNKNNNEYINPKERPQTANGDTTRYNTGCGKMYLTVNTDDLGNPIETFLTTGSDGGCQVMTEAVSRLVSMALRSGIDPEEIIDQLSSTSTCPSFMYQKGQGESLEGRSCPDVVGKVLDAYCRQKKMGTLADEIKSFNQGLIENLVGIANTKDPEILNQKKAKENQNKYKCPECGESMIPKEGCYTCKSCGYSDCS